MKQFHLYLHKFYPDDTTHVFSDVENAINNGNTCIRTTQVASLSTNLFDKGYHIYLHVVKTPDTPTLVISELKLGRNQFNDGSIGREIKMGHNIMNLLLAGEFDNLKELTYDFDAEQKHIQHIINNKSPASLSGE